MDIIYLLIILVPALMALLLFIIYWIAKIYVNCCKYFQQYDHLQANTRNIEAVYTTFRSPSTASSLDSGNHLYESFETLPRTSVSRYVVRDGNVLQSTVDHCNFNSRSIQLHLGFLLSAKTKTYKKPRSIDRCNISTCEGIYSSDVDNVSLTPSSCVSNEYECPPEKQIQEDINHSPSTILHLHNQSQAALDTCTNRDCEADIPCQSPTISQTFYIPFVENLEHENSTSISNDKLFPSSKQCDIKLHYTDNILTSSQIQETELRKTYPNQTITSRERSMVLDSDGYLCPGSRRSYPKTMADPPETNLEAHHSHVESIIIADDNINSSSIEKFHTSYDSDVEHSQIEDDYIIPLEHIRTLPPMRELTMVLLDPAMNRVKGQHQIPREGYLFSGSSRSHPKIIADPPEANIEIYYSCSEPNRSPDDKIHSSFTAKIHTSYDSDVEHSQIEDDYKIPLEHIRTLPPITEVTMALLDPAMNRVKGRHQTPLSSKLEQIWLMSPSDSHAPKSGNKSVLYIMPYVPPLEKYDSSKDIHDNCKRDNKLCPSKCRIVGQVHETFNKDLDELSRNCLQNDVLF